MTTTDWILQVVREGKPEYPAAELLSRFEAARDAAPAHDDPQWTAWTSGIAAARTDPGLPWIVVCAASAALADGDRAITAVALGCQVAERVAADLGPAHTEAGWDVRTTAGVIGAGAAAGWLCGLDDEQLRNAIGLCATQAAGLTGSAGTDAEAVQQGKAAADAVEAALLGQCGFTSSAEPLDGRRGLFALMGAGH